MQDRMVNVGAFICKLIFPRIKTLLSTIALFHVFSRWDNVLLYELINVNVFIGANVLCSQKAQSKILLWKGKVSGEAKIYLPLSLDITENSMNVVFVKESDYRITAMVTK